MRDWVTSTLITGTVVLLTQALFFFRWLYCSMRDSEVQRIFIRDIAMNHLPHIYSGLRDLARAQGIELADPPPVQFIQFPNGGRQK